MASISNTDELIDILRLKMGTNSDNVTDDGFGVAVDSALMELGWVLPCTHPKKVLWIINRSLRYTLEILLIESAHKFRYDKIFLQNRFEHYSKLIERMDKDFQTAIDEDSALFSTMTTIDSEYIVNAMTTYIPNLREYDAYGRE
jgi:hypothetical protein